MIQLQPLNGHTMKKILLIALCAASVPVYALPTYEPFTEFASTIASNPTNLVVQNGLGVSIGTNANGSVPGCIDLATGGYTAPGGEQWGSLNFSGTGTSALRGIDIAVISNANIFTQTALSSLLPSTFPGMPAAGQAITNCVENIAQPELWGTTNFTQSNYVGNSAVLKFASDVTRPTNGTRILYVSYLFAVAQQGQLGTGNDGRYLTFLASSNLVEGPGSGGAFTNWSSMFNVFSTAGTNIVHQFGHGLLESSGTSAFIGACDSSAGKDMTTSPFTVTQTTNPYTPVFVVGAYLFNSGTNKDTNFVWVNPATSVFGGTTPPTSPVSVDTMAFNMTDVGGLVIEDRPGNGASGGVGTNYIANLIIGSTWSYVTGGPEFTTQPAASTLVVIGGNATLTAAATAAGQGVGYQWQKVTGGVTNNLTDTTGSAGGSANVSGSQTATLNLTGVSAGDLGTFQCLATANGTSYTLPSSPALVISDPLINAQPQNVTVNYRGQATFTASITTAKPTLTYQWFNGATPLTNGLQNDGSTVSGASGTVGSGTSILTLTLTNISYQDIGSYSVFATNNVNNAVTSVGASLAVNDPYIITQPANPGVVAGGNATFTVAANGSPTVTYQWYENGTQLVDGNPTATGAATVGGSQTSTLTLTNVQDADNGSYTCTVSGSASLQNVTTTPAILTVQDPLTVASSPVSRAERVGDHLAFTTQVLGGGPAIQWEFNGTPIPGATSSALVLTNIQTGSNGTYTVVVSNLATAAITNSATLIVSNSPYLRMANTNVVVVRIGDGAQALSGNTGNTIYLDQYTSNGTYVSTIQVPDENVNQAYGTGSASSVFGSPALLLAGAGSDAQFEGFMTTSGSNNQFLDLAGYGQQYPFTGGAVNVSASVNYRGLATINAFGVYSMAYTNLGLYSGGNALIHSMVTLEGNSFWTTGEAGSGGLKYVNKATGSSYANGNGVPALTSSGAGTRVVQIFNNNIVFSDQAGASGSGIYVALGLPEPVPDNNVFLINEGGQPNDFAISPDGNTVYIADSQNFSATNSQSGGIERWDTNTVSGGYAFSYTLPCEPSATLGAQGLTASFSANAGWGTNVYGAVLYVTSATASSNTLSQIIDNGPGSIPTLLATAGPNQALRGVRFGPAAVPVSIATQPVGGTVFIGNNYTMTVSAQGSGPLSYQWQINGTNLAGATGSSLSFTNLVATNSGTYTVVITNLVPSTLTSTAAVLNVINGSPSFTVPSYIETVGDHLSFAPVVQGSLPFTYSWTFNGTPISTNPVVTLTNIQTSNSGTYGLTVSNSFGVVSNSGSLTVTTGLQAISATNLIVVRVGDGAQALSGATGNTMYLDQYTSAGLYVNTIQVPDEGTGQPYGTGSANSASLPFGSQALLIAGSSATGTDADYEGILTRSPDGFTLDLAGYVQGYPFAGADVTVSAGNAGNDWRGVGELNFTGSFSIVYTNAGLYSGGDHTVHSATTVDQANYWSAGQAGGGLGIKYITPSFEPANGLGIPGVAGSFFGTRVVQVVNSNLVFSDVGNPGQGSSAVGLWILPGLTGLAMSVNATNPATLLVPETNSPVDFAFSPDMATVYIADNGTFVGTSTPAGGVQRWDTNTVSGGYNYSYTLATGSGILSSIGARGVTVDFSAHATWGSGVTGAIVYATTAEASGNRLSRITDNGIGSHPGKLVQTGATNTLAGVRFGPSVEPLVIASEPRNQAVLSGSSGNAVFNVGVTGASPYYYQWETNGVAIPGATNATLAVNANQSSLTGYTVVVTNSIGQSVTSAPPASIYFVPVIGFNTNGSGWARNGTVSSGLPIYNGSNTVELTQGAAAQGSSTFFNDSVYVAGFLATWTYQVVNPSDDNADGVAFVIQNDPNTTSALGAAGGNLGYSGITNSVALQFNIFTSSAGGVGYAFDTNGIIGANSPVNPVVLTNGDPINVTLYYLNGLATLTLFDPVDSNSFTTNYQIDIPGTVGSDSAYVGFTGADGSVVSTQTISNFVYIPIVPLSAARSAGSLVLSWPTNVGGYGLIQNTSVKNPGGWVSTTNPVSAVNGVNQVTVPTTNKVMFYRLFVP
jgi:hypothetical protein